ncbi:MAG: bifunctional 5,10-methylenetetrahydrofolate dehydrogenase/5,10-methenyltetrahydrofolate cyclohydrolase [Erysipelotrichaceae bacterium]
MNEDKIIYGNILAKDIKDKLRLDVISYTDKGFRAPHLVVIQVGSNPASSAYVNGKEKDCVSVGFKSTLLRLDNNIEEEELLKFVKGYNDDSSVDGLLVQLPLPKHIDAKKILFAIDPNKDVDGFHPLNVGKMMINEPTYLPCTPFGCMRMLESVGYNDLSGLNAVVIGRSNIVGKPAGQLLLRKNATVTTVHSKTKNIEEICSKADILIAAIGKPKLIKENWVKKGAIIIDVGINRGDDGKLVGDVDFDSVIDKVKYITPVPKGVGLMTRAMLLENTMQAYKENIK